MTLSGLSFEDRNNINRKNVLGENEFARALAKRCATIFEFLRRGEFHSQLSKYEFLTGVIRPKGAIPFKIHTNLLAGITFDDNSKAAKRVLVISHIAICPKHRGGFWEFIKILLAVDGFFDCVDLIKIECLHDPAFAKTLVQRGWDGSKTVGDFYFTPRKADRKRKICWARAKDGNNVGRNRNKEP
jgi:hypothetical protein